ncbi:MAG: phosphodiesterase [Lachnospiraceae bacterium]|nr:phosphodiesterase [Lachnospiraceae bacterium]
MKWLSASDIHGSEFYCRSLIDAYKQEHADRLLLLGDLLYHGPRNDLPESYAPKKVIELLNSLKNDIFCVRGNCEAEVDQMVLDFPVMAEYVLIPAGDRMIFATHGHIFNKSKLPPLRKGDILLYGHTHIPMCEESDGIICMNPGSVSIPKEGSAHGYMTFEEGAPSGPEAVHPQENEQGAACEGFVFKWKSLDGQVLKEYRIGK